MFTLPSLPMFAPLLGRNNPLEMALAPNVREAVMGRPPTHPLHPKGQLGKV